jgi:hypothetical protein
MICETCGVSVAGGSSFCNRCGASIGMRGVPLGGDGRDDNYYNMVQSLIWAIVSVSIAGIGVLIGLMAVLKNVLNFPLHLIVGFSAAAFAVVLAADLLFIWMLLKVWRGGGPSRASSVLVPAIPAPPIQQPRLSAEPASVTEHTTRGMGDAVRMLHREE